MTQKHEGFVGFDNAWFRAKTSVIITSLNYVHSYARHFLTAKNAYMQSTKAVHQQHVNCLINTWVFASKNMAVNSVRRSFLCNYMGLSILLHGVISRSGAMSYMCDNTIKVMQLAIAALQNTKQTRPPHTQNHGKQH